MDAMADSSYDKKALAPLTELFRKDKPDVAYPCQSDSQNGSEKAGVPRIFHTKTLYGKRQRNTLKKTDKTDGEPSLQ